MRRIRVCHLSTVHSAKDVRIFTKESLSLVAEGYDVSVVASWKRDEFVGGVRILAIPECSDRLRRMTLKLLNLARRAFRQKADLYHFHDAELIPLGVVLRLLGKKVIYDVHEDLPRQIQNKDWIAPKLRSAFATAAALVEFCAGLAVNGVVAATPRIGGRFPKRKTSIVQNFPILGELVAAHLKPLSERDPFVVYIGGITVQRGGLEMVRAMSMLPSALNARLLMAGEFRPARLEQELSKLPGWERVDFQGHITRSEVARLLGRSRLGLVLFHPAPNHVESQPNKLFEYMSAGLPVVASDFPLWRKLIEQERCGLVVDPLDPAKIAKAILWLIEHPRAALKMSERGRQSVCNRYNWKIESRKLVRLYERLLPRSEPT
jgi:glycosyltransferase involved in cell wall biosynthesis